MVTISEGDSEYNSYKVRKGAGAEWLSYCHKPVDIKIVGVFDTVGSVGLPENKWIDVSKWNKRYAFHNTDPHPGTYFLSQDLLVTQVQTSNLCNP